MSQLRFMYMNELDPTTMDGTNDRIEKLSSEDIRKAAKQYLGGENYLEFVLYPEQEKAN